MIGICGSTMISELIGLRIEDLQLPKGTNTEPALSGVKVERHLTNKTLLPIFSCAIIFKCVR